MLTNATGMANASAAVIMLRYLTGSDYLVGLYGIGILIMNGMRLLPTALMGTAFPYLSGLLNNSELFGKRIKELSIKQGFVIGAGTLIWYIVGSPIIDIIFGQKFSGAFGASVILLVGLAVFSFGAPAGQALLMMDKVFLNFWTAFLKLITNIIFCFLLIPQYKIVGAAIAVSVSEIVSTLVTLLIMRGILRKDFNTSIKVTDLSNR
jgi:O-antigen/teichoic acid export membrane protein